MMRTLSGWISNAKTELGWAWGEPLTWIILLVAAGWVGVHWARGRRWSAVSALAYVGGVAWLIAALAITIYPIRVSFDPPPWERLEVESLVPLVGTIQSMGQMRDRTMTIEDHAALRAKIATDLEIPIEEVNLPREIHGTDLGVLLRDPVGNLFLFVPLGLVLAVTRGASRRRVALVAAAISGGIEASQLLFGFGSLASIDDVIFNTAGAVAGFAGYRLGHRLWRRAARPAARRPAQPIEATGIV